MKYDKKKKAYVYPADRKDGLSKTVTAMIALAEIKKKNVRTTFDGINICVHKGSSTEKITHYWASCIEKRRVR